MSEEVTSNRYSALIEKVFADSYSEGETEVPFKRTDLNKAASELNIETPKNLGDVVYSMRYKRVCQIQSSIPKARALSDASRVPGAESMYFAWSR